MASSNNGPNLTNSTVVTANAIYGVDPITGQTTDVLYNITNIRQQQEQQITQISNTTTVVNNLTTTVSIINSNLSHYATVENVDRLQNLVGDLTNIVTLEHNMVQNEISGLSSIYSTQTATSQLITGLSATYATIPQINNINNSLSNYVQSNTYQNFANTVAAFITVQQGENNALQNEISGLANIYSTETQLTNLITKVNGISPNSLGLSNVANTAPSDLPISTAVQNALNNIAIGSGANAAQLATIGAALSGLTASNVGLGNVANTGPSYFATEAQYNSLQSQVNGITKDSLGLGNVANTAASYFATEAQYNSLQSQVNGITKDSLGLSNVSNTAASYFATETQYNSLLSRVNGITKDSLGLGNVSNTAASYFATEDQYNSLSSQVNTINNSLANYVQANTYQNFVNNYSDFVTLQNGVNNNLYSNISALPSTYSTITTSSNLSQSISNLSAIYATTSQVNTINTSLSNFVQANTYQNFVNNYSDFVTIQGGVNNNLYNNISGLSSIYAKQSSPTLTNAKLRGQTSFGLNMSYFEDVYSNSTIQSTNALYIVSSSGVEFDVSGPGSTGVIMNAPTLFKGLATFYSGTTGLTSKDVGLLSFSGYSPLTLPVSTATQDAINAASSTVTAASIGLGNVANTGPSYFATAAQITSINNSLSNYVQATTYQNFINNYATFVSIQGGVNNDLYNNISGLSTIYAKNTNPSFIGTIGLGTQGSYSEDNGNYSVLTANTGWRLKAGANVLFQVSNSAGALVNTLLNVVGNTLHQNSVSCLSTLNVSGNTYLRNVNVGGLTTPESALVVVGSKSQAPTTFGIHMGTDNTTNCGITICAAGTTPSSSYSHIDFSYAGNLNWFNGSIGYDNGLNLMYFQTNQQSASMLLDSAGRLTLGANGSALASTTLYVSGSSYISGTETVNGNLVAQSNILMSGSSQKMGIGTSSPASALQVMGLKPVTPATQGIHLGMESASSNAGLSLIAANNTQYSYLDFGYAGNASNKGKIQYNHTSNSMLFYTNGNNSMILDTTGNLGIGITTPESALQIQGIKALTPTTMGIHLGMDSAITHAGVSILAANNASKAYLNFGFAATGATTNGSILYNNSGNYLAFSTAGVERLRIDNAGELLLGSTSSDGVHKLKVIGSIFCSTMITGLSQIGCTGAIGAGSLNAGSGIIQTTGSISGGSLSISGTKNFDIKSLTKPGYRLRHRCIEGPKAYLFYQFQYDCKAGMNEFDMPDYFDSINTDVLVYVSPYKCFGSAWGETANNTLIINCSADGTYNIQVIGTRNDKVCQDEYAKFGVEYPDPEYLE